MESERQKQEMAASYLSQQINKTVAERCPKREPYDVYLKRQQVQQVNFKNKEKFTKKIKYLKNSKKNIKIKILKIN